MEKRNSQCEHGQPMEQTRACFENANIHTCTCYANSEAYIEAYNNMNQPKTMSQCMTKSTIGLYAQLRF